MNFTRKTPLQYSRDATILAATALFAVVATSETSIAKGDGCEAPAVSDRARTDAEKSQSRTQLLAPYNGVLSPPSVGDGELVEPAPPAGRTPIIKPGERIPSEAGSRIVDPSAGETPATID